jgi:endogenous inhibitor of DNA gyrase (YacG/DUF329 family)
MSEEAARPAQRPCPICGKPTVAETQPFCSRRCARIDLGRWLKGAYAIPARPTDEAEGDAQAEEGEPPLPKAD